MKHIADTNIEWLHPADHPPPLGTKMLIYRHPHGTTVVGQWQGVAGCLWAPMPRVSSEMKQRLEKEFDNLVKERKLTPQPTRSTK